MSVDWTAKQLSVRALPEVRHGFSAEWNPRPAGVMRDDGATIVVLAYLRARPRVYFNRAQIIAATGKTQPAVQWALHYLRARGLVESTPEGERNPRYLRYRCKQASELLP